MKNQSTKEAPSRRVGEGQQLTSTHTCTERLSGVPSWLKSERSLIELNAVTTCPIV